MLGEAYAWHIFALADGTLTGLAFDYEITDEVKELAHKLLIYGK